MKRLNHCPVQESSAEKDELKFKPQTEKCDAENPVITVSSVVNRVESNKELCVRELNC